MPNIKIKQSIHEIDDSCFNMDAVNIANVVELYAEKMKSTLKEKLDAMYLFGSVARGDYTPASDIDILLVLNMEEDEIRATRSQLTKIGSDLDLEYNVFINKFTANKKEFDLNKQRRPLYTHVMREGVHL